MKQVEIRFLNGKTMDELGARDLHAGISAVKQIYSLYNHRPQVGDPVKSLTIPDKVVLRFGTTQEDEHSNGRINAMPGRIQDGDLDVAGIKWIGSGAHNRFLGLPRASALVILNDPVTKLPICIADGTQVSATRTGAAGGVAVELLARKNAQVLTICGAGVQGRTQLEAALISRPSLHTVYVYDKSVSNTERYIVEAQAKHPTLCFQKADALDELGYAVQKSDILITATTADRPFIQADWIRSGTLLINMASDEMERDCVLKADKTVVDFWDAVKHRNSSSIAHMVNDPEDQYQDFHPSAELGEILNGDKSGRENDQEIIYFNAVGAGVLDMMIVYRCFEQAEKENMGQMLLYWEGDEKETVT